VEVEALLLADNEGVCVVELLECFRSLVGNGRIGDGISEALARRLC